VRTKAQIINRSIFHRIGVIAAALLVPGRMHDLLQRFTVKHFTWFFSRFYPYNWE